MSTQKGESSIHRDDLINVATKLESFARAGGATLAIDTSSLHESAAVLSALGGRHGEIGDTEQPRPLDKEVSNWDWGWPF